MPRAHRAIAGLLFLGMSAGCGVGHDGVTVVGPTPGIVGSGRFVSEARPVQGFSRIATSGGIRVAVRIADAESLDVTAEDNVLPLLDIRAAGGTLTIGWKQGIGSVSAHGVDVKAGARELRGIDASGGSRIDVDGIAGEHLRVTLSGAARFAGSGSIDSLELDLSGASLVFAAGVSSRTVAARLSGASTAVVRVRDFLAASVSGASVLEFLGDPVVQSSVSDSSVVRRLGP